MMWTSAMPPLVTKILRPLRTHSSPSRRARVRRLETSEPDCGSVTAKAATCGASGVPTIRGAQAALLLGQTELHASTPSFSRGRDLEATFRPHSTRKGIKTTATDQYSKTTSEQPK